MSKANIFIHVSGSISAFKSASLISMLKKAGYSVRTSLSSGGSKFIGRATLSGISGEPVIEDQFSSVFSQMDHIDISEKWADLILIFPASANTINRLAAGMADDFIGAAFLANNNRVPFWIAPAMNSNMYQHPAVCDAIQKLSSWGVQVLPTGVGLMACGTEGAGRLMEADEVFERIELALDSGRLGKRTAEAEEIRK